MVSRMKKKGIEQAIALKGDEQLVNLEVSKIIPNPDQPRKLFNPQTIKELADSISASHQLVPILVAPLNNGKYLIIDGERRYRAATKHLKLKTMPALIKPMTKDEIEVNSLVANVQRDDLTPEEKEDYVHRLKQRFKTEEKVAEKIGWGQTTVSFYVQGYERRREISKRLLKVPEGTTTNDLVSTAKIEKPEAQVEFIEMLRQGRDGLMQNRKIITRGVNIYANADRDIQQRIYGGELNLWEAEKVVKAMKEVEAETGSPPSPKQKEKVIEYHRDLNQQIEAMKADGAAVTKSILRDETDEQTQARRQEAERVRTLVDTFDDMTATLMKFARLCDIHFLGTVDNPEEVARRQKRYMEIFAHVGAEGEELEILSKKLGDLEKNAQYSALVRNELGIIQPIIDAEIKNRRTIDVEKLR